MFSIDGLVSGFDTTSIISGLLQFQETQVDLLNSRKNEITTRQSAFGGIEAQLVNLRSALGKLNRNSSVFDTRAVSTSNEDVLTAAAGTDASPGTYTFTVNQLAQAEQLASQGFSDDDAELAQGEVTIRVGSRPPTTITIDSSNNSLSDFVNTVNAQTDDVSASIVFDQGTETYRVLFTSEQTGVENRIDVSSNVGGSGETITVDTLNPVQAAQDAEIVLGSGGGAITASSSDNQIDNLINGVTLNLESVSIDPVTISITEDTDSVIDAIEDFVSAFNAVVDFIDTQTAFDPESEFASPLAGNRNVSRIQDRLLNAVIENVPGLSAGLSRLADIGIDIDTTGRLELDKTRLSDALSGQVEGISPSEIRNLFGLNGTSTNQGIEFLLGSDLTTASGEPFEVDIVQAAEQATLTGNQALAQSIVIDGTNNTFTINVDGQESELLTLEQRTYTQEEFAAEVEAVINSSFELGNRNVSVSVDGGFLNITSNSYGSASEISGIDNRALGFSGVQSDNGQDVAGRFIVNGEVEKAVGTGQLLVGDSDNENTADLQLLVTLTPNQVLTPDSDGEITVTRGVTAVLSQYLGDILDPETGTLNTINDDFDEQIESIDQSIERVNAQTEARREFLIAEFAALERVLSDLQNTGNLLTSQLQSLGSFSPSS